MARDASRASSGHVKGDHVLDDFQIQITKEVNPQILEIYQLAPVKIIIPLLAAVFGAPLFSTMILPFVYFMFGRTGSHKSCVAAVSQSFFGSKFSYTNLPLNFGSTANAILKQTNALKDCFVVIDDYLPKRNSDFFMDRIIRELGNQAGRQRLDRNLNFQIEYVPLCVLLMTGEDIVRGERVRARSILMELKSGEVNLEVLSKFQELGLQG